MMKKTVLPVIIIALIGACNTKQKEPDKKYVSILSLIKKQVEHVDTSLYPILKITTLGNLPPDTIYIPREEFATVAKDFLDIPDLSDPKVAKRYKEEQARYDETVNRVVITYTPVNPDKEEVKKQELLVTPSEAAGDKVSNVILLREISNKDSFLQKKMLWQMDKSFQVVTTRQKPGRPEEITILKVSWNEPLEE
jgi:hypothetical protein